MISTHDTPEKWATSLSQQLANDSAVLGVFFLAGVTGLMAKPDPEWTRVELTEPQTVQLDPITLCSFLSRNDSKARFTRKDGQVTLFSRQNYTKEVHEFLLSIYQPDAPLPQTPTELLHYVSDHACVSLMAETLGDTTYR